jgi:hypothetical protein
MIGLVQGASGLQPRSVVPGHSLFSDNRRRHLVYHINLCRAYQICICLRQRITMCILDAVNCRFACKGLPGSLMKLPILVLGFQKSHVMFSAISCYVFSIPMLRFQQSHVMFLAISCYVFGKPMVCFSNLMLCCQQSHVAFLAILCYVFINHMLCFSNPVLCFQ